MPWKTTTPWLVGLAAAAGYVWFKRTATGSLARPFGNTSEVDEDELLDSDGELSAPASEIVRGYVRAERDELRALAHDTEIPPASAEMARFDALHDMQLGGLEDDEIRDDDLGERSTLNGEEQSVFDSEPATWEDDVDPISVLDRAENVHPSEHVVTPDETYDAIAPEDLGSEWLLRATEAGGPQQRSPGEELEGMQVVIDMNDNALEETEVPLVIDDAEELPLGEIDREGNTELHGRSDLRSRIRNNLDSESEELLPNEAELANRAAASEAVPRARKRQG